ncbi:MAG: hypothetical protein WBA46_09360 [Thermomicrobiales bacterium]
MSANASSSPFDASAWVGRWPFGGDDDTPLDQLIAGLVDAGIGGALVSPLNAVLAAEPSRANAELIAAAARRDDPAFDLRLAPIIDQTQADWRHELATVAAGAGERLGAIRIVPNYHAYSLSDSLGDALDAPSVDALAETLVGQGLPLIVQVRILDERAQHPRMVVPAVPMAALAALGGRHPELAIIAAGVFFSDLPPIREVANIAVELSSLESADTLPDILTLIPAARVVLGTHAPLYVPAASLAKLGGDGIDATTLAAIGGGTARALFRERLPASP